MPKILLVDDEPEIILLTRAMLEKEGYTVMEAGNGAECMKRLKEERPDLILLDIMMPGDDGWEICRRIKEDKKTNGIPVVTFTVRTSKDSVQRSLEYAHADAQIDKPFDKEELLMVVSGLLEK